MVTTSGDRGGADLTVIVVLRFESHEWETMDVGAREMTARLASSVACEMVPLKPCLAAIVELCFAYCVCGGKLAPARYKGTRGCAPKQDSNAE
mmetsp:Transcript_21771/g.62438  ORF Transcript_21771/g.62438 Transcript_21771/m.62438 type:complete len:93 (+) Transcript_21771:3331-3609(+)